MQPSPVANPFALMTAPEMVFAAIERSDRLARLKSTICRPLDNPRPAKPAVELGAFDAAIEAVEIEPEDPRLVRSAPSEAPRAGAAGLLIDGQTSSALIAASAAAPGHSSASPSALSGPVDGVQVRRAGRSASGST